VDRYRVDLAELLVFIDRLEAFDRRADEIGSAVDDLVAQLHGRWLGESAEAHRARHVEWMAESAAMREAVMQLHGTAMRAHDNYSSAIDANTAMWR
jgi:uncharacterized protein YukE